ncbi:potassium transporter TrkG [Jonesia denitrificans]|uniref:potassium transporter TrkG n=1 Tax=Jonesia denitrificans TaxID=43674 RepID=UPI00019BC80E|nr:potassium transporter TrkG [Jonesia denitrificans]SQH19993.1 Ktr system potassium uptake protein B [Jonesia denitrificans]
MESFRRRIPTDILRLAVAVTALSATLIIAASMAILEISGLRLDVVLFEVISAYATTGLSTGITAALPDSAHLILVVLMFAGRVGTMTFAAALTLRTRTRARRLPADRVLVG